MHASSLFVALLPALASLPGLGAYAAGPAPVGIAPGFGRVSAGHPAIAWDPNLGPEDLGVPRMIGCQIVNALMTRESVFTFVVKEKVRAALTIDDTTGKLLKSLGATVFIPENRLFCMGNQFSSHKSATEVRDWEPGTYEVRVIGECNPQYGGGCKPTNWGADTYRFELVDLTPPTMPLADGFTPNPMRIDGLRTDDRQQKMPRTTAACAYGASATSEAPALVLTLDRPWPHLRIWSEGGANNIVVTDADGRSVCSDSGRGEQRSRPYADLENVPAGRLEVRVAGEQGYERERDTRAYGVKDDKLVTTPLFAVSVEDWSRPRDQAWPAEVPAFSVGKGIAAPLVAANGPASAFRVKDCGDRRFGTTPVAFFDVTRPLTSVWLRLVTGGNAAIRLEGPFGPDRRELPDYKATCLTPTSGSPAAAGRLEMGRYAAYVGFVETRVPFALVAGDETTTLDPLALTLEPPATLPLGARWLQAFFGFLPTGHWTADVKQGLFLTAPDGLFVYPKFDLDEATAAIRAVDGGKRDLAAKDAAWPKKDEPLLIVGSERNYEGPVGVLHLLAADAAMYKIDAKYLAERAEGPRAVPAAARNLELEWNDAVKLATKAEQKDIDAYNKANDRAATCEDKFLAARGPAYRLAERTSGGSINITSHFNDRDLDAAYVQCGFPGLEAMQKRLLKKLDANYRKRLAEGLTKIRARFAAAP